LACLKPTLRQRALNNNTTKSSNMLKPAALAVLFLFALSAALATRPYHTQFTN
jgi:hypothetical protein